MQDTVLKEALAPSSEAEERVVEYLAAVAQRQTPTLIAMISRVVAAAYERGWREALDHAREQHGRVDPELWDGGGAA